MASFRMQETISKLFVVFFFLASPVLLRAHKYSFQISEDLKNKSPQELVQLIKESDSASIDTYERALWKKSNYPSLAQTYYELGLFFYEKEYFKKAVFHLNKASILASEFKDYKLLCAIYGIKGHTYLREGKNQKALDSYYEALRIAEEKEYIDRQLVVNSGIIIVLKRMNQLEKAREISEKMLKSIKETTFEKKKNHVMMLTTISDVYLDLEQYDSVLSFAKTGIKISEKLDYKEGLVDLNIKKGIVFCRTNRINQAFECLLKAKDMMQNYDIKNQFFPKTNINYFLASCFYKQKKYKKAIIHLHEILDTLEKKNLNITPVIQSHLLLANCYSKINELEKAWFWHDKYVKLNLDYQKNKDKTVSKIYGMENQKFISEINELKKKQVANEKQKTKILIFALFISVVILGFGIWYYNKQKRNRIVFSELMDQIDQLKVSEQKNDQSEDVKEVVIDDVKVNQILKNLEKMEESEYFLRSDCNLRSIATKIKTNTTYLSLVIKEHKGKKFNSYINDLRIDYALKRLKSDKKFRSFSIGSIAKEIGYKSDNSFTKHFKAKTGLNPSYYIKKIQDLEKQLL